MAGESDSLSRYYMFLQAFSLGYFAIKFDLLMFSNISNIFDTISKFTVELKVYFLLFTKTTTKNGGQCKYAFFSHKNIILVGEFVENQFKIA